MPLSSSPSDTKESSPTRFDRLVSAIRLTLALATVFGALYLIAQLLIGNELTEADIEQTIRRFGVFAPITFILAFAFAGSLIVPTTALAIVGATLFGDYYGFFYSMIGAQIAAVLGFLAARTLGRDAVKGWIGDRTGKVAWLNKRLADHGFTTALIMRLVYLPNGLINVVCGISGIRASVYTVATFFGLMPIVFAVVFVAASAKEAIVQGDWSALWQAKTIFAIALYFAAISTPVIAGVVRRRPGSRVSG